jgi:hypothetical protein
MSMGREYVSELLQPTGLLLIPKWYEYGEPRWNNTDRTKLRNSEKKTYPVPPCPLQIPQGLTQASELIGRRLIAWAMARPIMSVTITLVVRFEHISDF